LKFNQSSWKPFRQPTQSEAMSGFCNWQKALAVPAIG